MHYQRLPVHMRRGLQRILSRSQVHEHARARRLLGGGAQHSPAEVLGLYGLDVHVLRLGALTSSAISRADSARSGACSGACSGAGAGAAQVLCRQRVQERLGLRHSKVSCN